MMPTRHDLLIGSWVHSHEEDRAGQVTYRPASFALPPSRGRRGFDLHPDGTMAEFGPGPTDRPTARAGRWAVGEDGCLTLHADGPDRAGRVLTITSLAADKLVVAR